MVVSLRLGYTRPFHHPESSFFTTNEKSKVGLDSEVLPASAKK